MVSCCMKTAAGSTLALGAVLLIAGAVLGFKVFPDAVKEKVAEKVMLKEGTEAWNVWQKLPIPMEFKVYFFNVTNVDEILAGGTPIVNEVGPYVYNEYREKEQIDIRENYGTAAYYQRTLFEFNEEKSFPLTESDPITMVNVAMMGMIETAEIETPNLVSLLGGALGEIFVGESSIFLTETVKKVLFDGMTINCKGLAPSMACRKIRERHPAAMREDGNGNLLFALFAYKNDSYDGYYEVKLGWRGDGPYPSVDAAKTIGKIVSWENSTKLKTWSGDRCNEIVGTDAAIFPPFLTKDSRIDIFSTDLCRSLYATYSGEGNYKDIDSLIFTAKEYMLGDVTVNPDNNCYCPEKNACLFKGSLDLTACQGAPVILTFPHFFMASESYQKNINGVSPDRKLHETFLELEPNTGYPLRGAKRVQFNILMKTVSGVPFTYDVPTALFPILWIDEGLELDDANVNRLKDELISILKILEGVKWGLIGVGIVLLCVGVILSVLIAKSARSMTANLKGN
ncbi:hypothetical protein J437_LFUL013188 [Ladona fulva]|uniref:Sensory neuron membrane protein 2 n=1 Tax=Ladona fulva TaxID=123851 RepID=A0A8K0P5K6_LADFU|nr:hypothetical protein J437_LFUL013188 [Ladona fulva]